MNDHLTWFYSLICGPGTSIKDLKTFADKYQNSPEEIEDIRHAYLTCDGDMDGIFHHVPCSNPLEDEDRLRGIIQKLIDDGSLPSLNAFVNEPSSKRAKRLKVAKKEAKAAEKVLSKMREDTGAGGAITSESASGMGDLIARIQKNRHMTESSFLEKMEEKYRNLDEPSVATSRKSKKSKVYDLPTEEEFEKIQTKLSKKAKK